MISHEDLLEEIKNGDCADFLRFPDTEEGRRLMKEIRDIIGDMEEEPDEITRKVEENIWNLF